jgi:hypothetical protein
MSPAPPERRWPGASVTLIRETDFHGYPRCLELSNGQVRVVLGPQCGGRVLAYGRGGAEAIALDPAQAGWTWRPGAPELDPWGGRFDVGPEKTIARHPTLWLGAWGAEPAGDGAVRMTSAVDPATGLRLTRELRLAPDSSHLRCTQTMTNAAGEPLTCCHWGRTLAPGGGIAVFPATPGSRFPHGYVQYDASRDGLLDFAPRDPCVRVRDGLFEVFGPPRHPKLCFDGTGGWLGWLMPSGLLFVKRWPVFPDRVYNDLSAFTLSLWLWQDRVAELEPIGPAERLAPGASASFTEDWWLLEHPFPARRDALDLAAVAERVARQAR